jgi:hypothetical protein
MSILSNPRLATAIGLGTTAIGAAGNALGQLLGTGTNGNNTAQNRNTTQLRTFGGMRDNLFATQIGLPAFLSKASFQGGGIGKNSVTGNKDEGLLMLYAESVNLPGVNIGTGETRRYGFGPTVRYAKDISFNDISVNFIGDGAGVILKVFSEWMNGIVKFDEYLSPSNTVEKAPFFFRYKNEYVANEFFITVFNEKRDEVAVYYLEDAFPTSVSDISLNWGSTNQLARFSVNFTYTRWTHKSATVDLTKSLNTERAGDQSVLSMIFRTGTAATVLTSLKKPQSIGDVVNVVNNARLVFGGGI